MKKKIKILITGKDGKLATSIYNCLKKKYYLISYSKKDVNITKKKNLDKLSLKNTSILINTAAYNEVEKSEKNYKTANRVNFLALKNLKKICDTNKIFLIHFSSDYVFDGKVRNYKEHHKTNPLNKYGKSKANGENFLLKSKINNFLILRISWVYSNLGNNFYTKIFKLLKMKKTINVVSDQFGIPTSTKFVTFILDKLIKEIINKKKLSKIYHLTPNGETSWYKFSLLILKYLLKKYPNLMKRAKIMPIKSNFNKKAKRPMYSILNSKKIQNRLNLKFKNWQYYFAKELR